MNSNRKNHMLMILLLMLWTIDAVVVSSAVESINPLFLIFLKTVFSIPILAISAHILKQRLTFPKKEDWPRFALCAVLGDILYFYFEYTAYKYLPIGMVTLLLGMLPLASYIVDCLTSRKKPEIKILVLIIISIIGLGIAVLSGDNSGSAWGYISCVIATAIWICYGRAIKPLGEKYEITPLTFYESLLTVIILLPLAVFLRPQEMIECGTIVSIAVMGMVMNGLGYILENNGLISLGTTISGIYINLLPVCTSIVGVLFLNETMSIKQIAGFIIVIVCGIAVIVLNGKQTGEK